MRMAPLMRMILPLSVAGLMGGPLLRHPPASQ